MGLGREPYHCTRASLLLQFSFKMDSTASSRLAQVQPAAINDFATVIQGAPPLTNEIVGMDGAGHAVIWDYSDNYGNATNICVEKQLTQLAANPAVFPAAPWLINSAVGINDSGAIVGTALVTTILPKSEWTWSQLISNFLGGSPPMSAQTHGVLLLPDQITRDGNPINSTNSTVVVGQQINLTNMISGVPTSAITSWKWSVPGRTERQTILRFMIMSQMETTAIIPT